MEQKEKVAELIGQMTELVVRINLETEMASWLDISGHVSSLKITVAASKENYQKKVTAHEMYYDVSYSEDRGFAVFVETANEAIQDLNNLLSAKCEKTYTAYCNLIDMGCSQVFTSEAAAKKWVAKMKKKYNKVNAIVGYREELVKTS